MQFLGFFEISTRYATLNPAAMIMLFFWELTSIYKIEVDYLLAFFIVIGSNLLFWVPMARYVMIPLLNRVFYPKGRDGKGSSNR